METSYLQDPGQCGNVLKGFEGFLSSSKNTALYGVSSLWLSFSFCFEIIIIFVFPFLTSYDQMTFSSGLLASEVYFISAEK